MQDRGLRRGAGLCGGLGMAPCSKHDSHPLQLHRSQSMPLSNFTLRKYGHTTQPPCFFHNKKAPRHHRGPHGHGPTSPTVTTAQERPIPITVPPLCHTLPGATTTALVCPFFLFFSELAYIYSTGPQPPPQPSSPGREARPEDA